MTNSMAGAERALATMDKAPRCHSAFVVATVLMAGCAGIERAPLQRAPVAASAEAIVPVESRSVPALASVEPAPSSTVARTAVASAPVVRAAEPARPAAKSGSPAKPAASSPPSSATTAASPQPAATALKTQTPAPPLVKPAATPPPLDLKSLESRLKETKAIGVFTKLALKNQIDDLLDRFRAFYQGRIKTSLAGLRRSFDLLVMKTLALLQDGDAPLASALAASRESIWGILSDPAKFARL